MRLRLNFGSGAVQIVAGKGAVKWSKVGDEAEIDDKYGHELMGKSPEGKFSIVEKAKPKTEDKSASGKSYKNKSASSEE